MTERPNLAGRPGAGLPGLRVRLRALAHEFGKFGIVGAVAYAVDVGVFNLLRVGLDENPLLAKAVSVVVATTVSYAGNRNWTWRHRDRSGLAREYPLFFLFNGVGLAIGLACVWVSHYLLGFTSPLADNIAANVVGVGLGAGFRFWSYRTWVFRGPRGASPPR